MFTARIDGVLTDSVAQNQPCRVGGRRARDARFASAATAAAATQRCGAKAIRSPRSALPEPW